MHDLAESRKRDHSQCSETAIPPPIRDIQSDREGWTFWLFTRMRHDISVKIVVFILLFGGLFIWGSFFTPKLPDDQELQLTHLTKQKNESNRCLRSKYYSHFYLSYPTTEIHKFASKVRRIISQCRSTSSIRFTYF